MILMEIIIFNVAHGIYTGASSFEQIIYLNCMLWYQHLETMTLSVQQNVNCVKLKGKLLLNEWTEMIIIESITQANSELRLIG